MFSQEVFEEFLIVRSLTRNFRLKKSIRLVVRSGQSLWQSSAVVFGHAILPFEEVGNALRLDADFYASQAGKQQVHFVAKADGSAQILRRGSEHLNVPAPTFQETPAGRQFLKLDQCRRREIEPFAADAALRLLPEGFFTVSHEIGTGDFAFHQYRVARLLPSNGVRHLSADASLLGQHDAAAIQAQPSARLLD